MWSPHGAWGRLFAAAGVHIVLPVGGVSEAVTMRLALDSDLQGPGPLVPAAASTARAAPVPSACTRSSSRPPSSAARSTPPSPPTIRGAAKWLRPPPYGGQEMVEYGLARVPGIEQTLFGRMLHHFDATEESTSWLDHCYPPALDGDPRSLA